MDTFREAGTSMGRLIKLGGGLRFVSYDKREEWQPSLYRPEKGGGGHGKSKRKQSGKRERQGGHRWWPLTIKDEGRYGEDKTRQEDSMKICANKQKITGLDIVQQL